MKKNTINKLYDVRQDLIDIYLEDTNEATRKEIQRLIDSLTKIIEANH